jgi:DNA (cytosine-5)-methyltransferase 1
MTDLVLSLFPGIGLLDMAFEEAGFCVVRGPDRLWGGDIHAFHPPAGRFDGIIGGPPCQAFSRLRHLVAHNGYQVAPNLIPEYERVVTEARPAWFLMENVPAAPEPVVPGYGITSLLLNNRWVGGVQHRERRFSFGLRGGHMVNLAAYLQVEAFEPAEWAPAVLAGGGLAVPVAIGGSGKVKSTARANKKGIPDSTTAAGLRRSCELQGLPADFLDDAPFTTAGKHKVVGNGVPLPMGRAIAAAVVAALAAQSKECAA